jgi:hypothetical protein
MKKFRVRYTLSGFVYESELWTSDSGSALYWVTNAFPDALNISVVGTE